MIAPLLAVLGLSAIGAGAGWWAGGSVATRRDALDPTSPVRAAVLAYLVFHVAGSVVLIVTGESNGAGPLLAAGALAAFGVGAAGARWLLGPQPRFGPPVDRGLSRPGVAGLAASRLVALGTPVAR